MTFLKRVSLFFVTSILILATVSIILKLLGIEPYLSSNGLNYATLMKFCLVWGMVGSLISLALSRVMAKMLMGVKLVDPANAGQYAPLIEAVGRLRKAAGLSSLPEVGVYQSPELNAFATGPTKNRSLVAVSSGLLARMNRQELEGVLAHEIAHIRNGDMVTMTLLQGIINAFVMFFSKIISFAVSQNVKEEYAYITRFVVELLLYFAFSALGFLVVCWFSRRREFRADHGGAVYAGRDNMISALEALARNKNIEPQHEASSLATLKIFGSQTKLLFSTHPPLEKRIAQLKTASLV